MSTGPRRGRAAVLIALMVLLSGGAWWITARPRRGGSPPAPGRSAYDRGEWQAAASWAREELKTAPTDPGATRLLARSSARLGRDDAALALFQRLGTHGLEAEDHLLVARILARHDQPASARAQLWKAHRADPTHVEALHELVRGLAQDDAVAKAVELAEALRVLPGWQARGAVALGLLRAAEDDPAAAAEALESALELDPHLAGPPASAATVRKLLARHRLALGQPARARTALGPLEDSEARWLRGRADLQEGQPCQDVPRPSRDPLAQEPAPYLGSARCAPCHSEIARGYRDSHHARTFWAGATLAALPMPDQPLPDPANPGVVHTIRRQGETTRVETRVNGQPTYQAVVAYAFGSGDRGWTPVGRDPAGHWYELRISRYGDGPAWDVTTGHDRVPSASSEWLGKTLGEDDLRRCVDCHTTAPRVGRRDAGALAGERGIGCERCHGPGGNHLLALDAGLADPAITRPDSAAGEPIVRLCGQCHSPRGRTVSPSEPTSIRFQATTLTWSRCYTATQGRTPLDCLTCHDPHRNAETAPAFYERKCLNCHGPAGSTRCPVNPTRDCIGCHMPTVRGAVPHSPFTDHDIRVHALSR